MPVRTCMYVLFFFSFSFTFCEDNRSTIKNTPFWAVLQNMQYLSNFLISLSLFLRIVTDFQHKWDNDDNLSLSFSCCYFQWSVCQKCPHIGSRKLRHKHLVELNNWSTNKFISKHFSDKLYCTILIFFF